MRHLYLILGCLFTVIGAIGIVTPLLPSTPFFLLAAGCFARSSERFHSWLINHPKIGSQITDWQKNGVIRLRAKILATVFMIINASFPFWLISGISLTVKFLVGIIMGGVLIFIWSRPSNPSSIELER
jgi:uncharacterized membrane protein YbaN (DUF454 family)